MLLGGFHISVYKVGYSTPIGGGGWVSIKCCYSHKLETSKSTILSFRWKIDEKTAFGIEYLKCSSQLLEEQET